MSETRRLILDTARGLFNERGLSRVGVREIARATRMSPGNLAYHFPTKDQLVAELLTELYEINQRTVFTAPMDRFSLVSLYRAATGAMRNMLTFRFVLLSYVDAVRASPRLAGLEADLARRRRRRHDEMLAALVANGFVARAAIRRGEILYEQGALISSGWLRSATLRGWADERAVLHYAKLGCALLEPHCTEKGARQLRRIRRGACDEPASAGGTGGTGETR